MSYEEETFELRQLVIDAYQLHDRMFRLGANLPALREWAERFHDISDLPEDEIGPTAQSKIDRLRVALEAIKNLGESDGHDMRDLEMYSIAVDALLPNSPLG